MLTTVFLPLLFSFEPGLVDPDIVEFICLPPKAWEAEQQFDYERARKILGLLSGLNITLKDNELHKLLCNGALFLAHLDRRNRNPLIFDPVYGAWLYLSAQRYQMVNCSDDRYWGQRQYHESDIGAVGFSPGFSMRAVQNNVNELLSQCTLQWFAAIELLEA